MIVLKVLRLILELLKHILLNLDKTFEGWGKLNKLQNIKDQNFRKQTLRGNSVLIQHYGAKWYFTTPSYV